MKQHFTYLEEIALPDVNGEQVVLLIGSNNGRLLVPTEIVEPTPGPGSSQLPIALHTPLGWVVTNCLPTAFKGQVLSAYSTRVETEADICLRQLVESSMKIETLGIITSPTVTRSKEEERALKAMKASTHKIEGEDAYISPLLDLWKDKEPKLPDNYEGALRRLCSLEKRLEKDTQLKERYEQSMEEDIKRNYVRKLSKEEADLPIILDSKHDLARLLIAEYHQDYSHPSTNYLLYIMRRRYWIIGARNSIRKFTYKCVTCKKLRFKPIQPKMADLPAVRVTPGKFFDKVGVDFFGPLLVKRGRSEIKRYGCLFTCLKIRAVHIELAESFSTDAFLLCLRNFIGRRGQLACVAAQGDGGRESGERKRRGSGERGRGRACNEAPAFCITPPN